MRNDILLLPLDQKFDFRGTYAVIIPAGVVRDREGNFFRGTVDEELVLNPRGLQLLATLQVINQKSILFPVFLVIAGIYASLAGYRNLYYSILFINAATLSLLFIVLLVSLLFQTVSEKGFYFVTLIEVASAGIGLLISSLFLRLLPGVAIRLYCAIGAIFAALPLLHCLGDMVLLACGFLSLYEIRPFFHLVLAST